MRIFLTGATSFIGRHIVPLLGMDHEIIALTTHDTVSSIFPHVSFIQGNLLQDGEAKRLFKYSHADMLIHLAWNVAPGNFWNSPLNMDWLAASQSLVRAFVEQGGKRMVFTGSVAEYDWNSPMPLEEEENALLPRTFYGVCKNALHQVVKAYAASAGVSCLWCRLFWVYGPGEPPKKFLSSIIEPLINDEQAICHAANLKRDYIHVQDVAHALATAAQSSLTGALNIGRGEAVSLGQMARLTASILKKSELLTLNTAEISEANPEIVIASTRRLTRELGWKPRYSLLEGITSMIKIAKSTQKQKNL